ncbi:uncharacterized protein LOC134542402 [Bacillus rossius redtenbacheri]|uniref:uncharacterized protein LOC134542402 n=1 Tax=Bacillus rossius redtenbacheri TaxID=93214 RepID=UPI002FDCA7C5
MTPWRFLLANLIFMLMIIPSIVDTITGREYIVDDIKNDNIHHLVSKSVVVIKQNFLQTTKSTVFVVSDTSKTAGNIISQVQSDCSSPLYVIDNKHSGSQANGIIPAVEHTETESVGFIIISDDDSNDFFLDMVLQLSQTKFWDCQSNFLLVFTEVQGAIGHIGDILRRYWTQYEILNCVAMFLHEVKPQYRGSRPFIKGLTLNPFKNGGIISRISTQRINIFPNKLYETNGFPIKLIINPVRPFIYEEKNNGNVAYRGSIYELVSIFSKPSNFTLIKYGLKPSVNLSQWAIPQTFENEPDFDIIFQLLTNHKQLKSSTYPVLLNRLIFIVPKAEQMPAWLNTFLPFTLSTWISYITFVLLTTLSCKIISSYCRHPTRLFQSLEIY